MQINYADHHKWVKTVPRDDVFGSFGDSGKEKLKSTLNKISDSRVTSIIRPVDEFFLSWFIPMYTENIHKKGNPKIHPIKDKVLNGNKIYYALQLFEDQKPVGGTIFSVQEATISIAYRVYSNDWLMHSFRASPSLYTEYLIEQHARTIDCVTIIHGRDRNPYGMNAGIGLAIFKLAVGCQPYLSSSYELKELNTENCSEDALVFEYPGEEDQKIAKAYLITSPSTQGKWSAVIKYPQFLDVEVVNRV